MADSCESDQSVMKYRRAVRGDTFNLHFFSQRIVDRWNKLPDDLYLQLLFLVSRLDIWMDRYGRALKANSLTSPLIVTVTCAIG